MLRITAHSPASTAETHDESGVEAKFSNLDSGDIEFEFGLAYYLLVTALSKARGINYNAAQIELMRIATNCESYINASSSMKSYEFNGESSALVSKLVERGVPMEMAVRIVAKVDKKCEEYGDDLENHVDDILGAVMEEFMNEGGDKEC